MKEIRLTHQNSSTHIAFSLPEKSNVELFLHNVRGSRSIRLAKMVMQKGLRQLQITGNGLQAGVYIYVLKANQQQMDFGRIVISN